MFHFLTQPKKDNNQLKKNTQHCQKIELNKIPTTKVLKRNIHPDWCEGQRQTAGAEMTCDKAAASRPGRQGGQLMDQAFPHLHVEKPGGTTGE